MLPQKFPKSVRSYSNLSLNVPGSQKVTLTFDLRLRNSKVIEEKKTSSEGFWILALRPIETLL